MYIERFMYIYLVHSRCCARACSTYIPPFGFGTGPCTRKQECLLLAVGFASTTPGGGKVKASLLLVYVRTQGGQHSKNNVCVCVCVYLFFTIRSVFFFGRHPMQERVHIMLMLPLFQGRARPCC